MSKHNVNIGVVQMSCTDDVQGNLDKAVSQIKKLAKEGAQIVCLQELFRSLYFCQEKDEKNFELAESIPGPTTETFQTLAKDLNIVIVASLFEEKATGVHYNTTAVIDADGSYLGKYRKMHIPDDPDFQEKYYFAQGDLGYQVFKTKYAKVGVLICWDQWYPEAARLTALKGAEVIVYPTAIGWVTTDSDETYAKQLNAWKTVQAGHAIANEVYVVTPNRVGQEGDINFWGNSFVVDPFGETLYQASADKEESKVVPIDLSVVKEYRRSWQFFRDRRVDSYEGILQRSVEKGNNE